MKTRIVESWNTDSSRGIYPKHYSCQIERKFLFWNYWVEFDWFYSMPDARCRVDWWRIQNPDITNKGVINIVDYPKDRE
ncbi:hypothetical protein [Pseudomonas sp.]|uniref:hypothetical protein n=1 Tax=Pseudomonas sp. TaxID=306 RepID=UPI003FD84B50